MSEPVTGVVIPAFRAETLIVKSGTGTNPNVVKAVQDDAADIGLAAGDIDFGGDYIQVNTYWYHEHFSGRAKDFLSEIIPAMKGPDFFDHSDAMTDYFHCSHYIDVNIGKWNQPYALVK